MSLESTTYFAESIPECPCVADGELSTSSADPGLAISVLEVPPPKSARVFHNDSADRISDESLMEYIAEGNRDALAALFRRHGRMVKAVAQRILRDSFEADDLLQEVFLFLFRNAVQ